MLVYNYFIIVLFVALSLIIVIIIRGGWVIFVYMYYRLSDRFALHMNIRTNILPNNELLNFSVKRFTTRYTDCTVYIRLINISRVVYRLLV